MLVKAFLLQIALLMSLLTSSELLDTPHKLQAINVFSCSVGDTDWKAEIEAFRKGVAEDAVHVQHQAHVVAREGVTRIENLPHQAAHAKFPPMDPAKMKSQIDQVWPQ